MEIVSAAVSVDVQLNKKELQFLELRRKLKERFREELKKESGSVHNSLQEKKKLPDDNYGSFFGRSQHSIARRVIMESEAMLQVQQSATMRHMNSSCSKSKPALLVHRMEADKLKALRDYSSILSDEAENLTSLTATTATTRKANPNHPNSDMQSALSSSITKKLLDKRDQVPYQHKICVSKLHSVTKKSMEQDRKFHQACNAEVVPKLVKCTAQYQIPNEHKVSSVQKPEEKIDCVEPNKKVKVKLMQNKLQSSSNVQASDVHNKASLSKTQSVTKRQPEQEMERHGPKKANLMPGKLQSCSLQHKALNENKASMSKLQNPAKQQMRQGKELQKTNKEKVISTPAKSLSKHQIKRPACDPSYDDDEADMSYISSLCQNLFRRNDTKQINDDHDFNDDCMVSSFSDILKEERKSAKIARKEDETELLRIEREEREEKLRRKAKKQKLQQN